jgi:hypothetical protein
VQETPARPGTQPTKPADLIVQASPQGRKGSVMNILNINSLFRRVDRPATPVAEDWDSLRNAARSASERAEIDAIFSRPPFVA